LFARRASYDIDLENWGPVAEWFNEHGEALNQQLGGYQGIDHARRPRERSDGRDGLYDSEGNAREVDASMDQGAPEGMPEELREILMRGTRTSRGVYEVVQSAGSLGEQ